jgi:hypothetical protein
MHVASAGGIDREASFIYVYMRCARDVLELGRELSVTVWDSNQRRGSVLTN